MSGINYLSLGESIIKQPLGDNPEHVRIVTERVNQEPDAHTLLSMMGISCA